MFSVPDGRAANHPLRALTFRPPIGAPLLGAWVIWLRSAHLRESTLVRPQLKASPDVPSAPASRAHRYGSRRACRTRPSGRDSARRILARAAVISAASRFMISRPCPWSTPYRPFGGSSPSALLAPEADRSIQQPGRKPLEPDRHLHRARPSPHDAVDQAARDQRLATAAAPDQPGDA